MKEHIHNLYGIVQSEIPTEPNNPKFKSLELQ